MGLRERLSMPMDLYQRILLICVLVIPLILQISTEFYYLRYYYPRPLHIAMSIGVILLLLNPKGMRMLMFGFFTYLLIEIFKEGSYSDDMLVYAFRYCLFGLPLMWLGLSIKLILYIHIGVCGILAYFSYKSPFKTRKKLDPEVLDQLDS